MVGGRERGDLSNANHLRSEKILHDQGTPTIRYDANFTKTNFPNDVVYRNYPFLMPNGYNMTGSTSLLMQKLLGNFLTERV